MNPKDENKVIGPGKPNEVSKSPWSCEVRKRAGEAQGKQTGPGRPRENKWDKGVRMGQRSPKAMKWVKDAQKNKMGQRSPKMMK